MKYIYAILISAILLLTVIHTIQYLQYVGQSQQTTFPIETRSIYLEMFDVKDPSIPVISFELRYPVQTTIENLVDLNSKLDTEIFSYDLYLANTPFTAINNDNELGNVSEIFFKLAIGVYDDTRSLISSQLFTHSNTISSDISEYSNSFNWQPEDIKSPAGYSTRSVEFYDIEWALIYGYRFMNQTTQFITISTSVLFEFDSLKYEPIIPLLQNINTFDLKFYKTNSIRIIFDLIIVGLVSLVTRYKFSY